MLFYFSLPFIDFLCSFSQIFWLKHTIFLFFVKVGSLQTSPWPTKFTLAPPVIFWIQNKAEYLLDDPIGQIGQNAIFSKTELFLGGGVIKVLFSASNATFLIKKAPPPKAPLLKKNFAFGSIGSSCRNSLLYFEPKILGVGP